VARALAREELSATERCVICLGRNILSFEKTDLLSRFSVTTSRVLQSLPSDVLPAEVVYVYFEHNIL
jgi:hypothetical protein